MIGHNYSRGNLPGGRIASRRDVHIPPLDLAGVVQLPSQPIGVVAFAHGSGSSRFGLRNVAVADALNDAGFGTLLFDLLTSDEEIVRRNVFDISLLAERLINAVQWVDQDSDLAGAALESVRSPTLLIVGGDDDLVLELNEQALARLRAPKALQIVPGASHLFPEPGALEAVIEHATRWFSLYLKHRANSGN